MRKERESLLLVSVSEIANSVNFTQTRNENFEAMNVRLAKSVCRSTRIPIASAVVAFMLSMGWLSASVASDSDTFTKALAHTNQVYSKNHMIVMADVEYSDNGEKLSYRYDRYPEVERIKEEKGTFARKTNGKWLTSDDWAETGKPVSAKQSDDLDDLVATVNAALNKNLTPPNRERSIAEIKERRPKGEHEWVIYETRKEKTFTFNHPQFVFFVDGKDDQGLLIGYAGYQSGGRDVHANLNFSVMFAVNVVDAKDGAAAPADQAPAKNAPEPDAAPTPEKTIPAPAAPALLPAPEKDKTYGFMEITLHRKELFGKVVPVEIAPKPGRKTELKNGMVRAVLTDVSKMSSFGWVDCTKDGLDKLGLENGTAKKSQIVYVLIEKESLTGMERLTAVGRQFQPGADGKGTYSW